MTKAAYMTKARRSERPGQTQGELTKRPKVAMAEATDAGEAARDDETDHVRLDNDGFAEPTIPMDDERPIVLRPNMSEN